MLPGLRAIAAVKWFASRSRSDFKHYAGGGPQWRAHGSDVMI